MTVPGRSEAKALPKHESVDQGRRLENRTRLDTVVVPAVNDVNKPVVMWIAFKRMWQLLCFS